MFHIVLVEPEIPQNTGNIIRLCANTGAQLHLVRPLGFIWDDRRLKRAGLDYFEYASVRIHEDWAACRAYLEAERGRLFLLTTRGKTRYDMVRFAAGDVLVFGSESRGVSDEVRAFFAPEAQLVIPMRTAARSLNLANAVAIALYEAWRQLGFTGALR